MLLKGANSVKIVWGDIAKDTTASKKAEQSSNVDNTKDKKSESKYAVLDWSFVNKLTNGPKEKATSLTAKPNRPEDNYSVLDWRFVSKLTK
jgi:hypothetical protein